MAESMTYDSLVADIKSYSERSDANFVAQVPRFIMMAENRIATEVRGLGFLRAVTGNLTLGSPILDKPARWRETLSFGITVDNERKFLKYRSYGYCRMYSPTTATDEPLYYADYDYEHYLIAPTPDDDYEIEIQYHERPVPLDATNQINWTTQYAPQLILAASLLEAQTWLKLTSRVPEFQAMYERAAAGVSSESQRRLSGDQSLNRTVG